MSYMIGAIFPGLNVGYWEVIEKMGWRKHRRHSLWKCKCKCGTIRVIASSNLRLGKSRSCGCAGISRDDDGLPLGSDLNRRYSNNKTGFRGVYWDERKGKFFAEIGNRLDNNNNRFRLGPFATPDDAARAYDRQARKVYGAKAVLNFPLPNEVGVIIIRDDKMCPRGHDLSIYGYIARGREHKKPLCRKCNANAAKRLKERHRLITATESL